MAAIAELAIKTVYVRKLGQENEISFFNLWYAKKACWVPCAKKIYISWEKSGMQKRTKSRFFAGNKVRWFCTIIEKRCTAEKWLFIIIMLSRLMIYEHFSLSVLQAGVKMSIKAKCLPRNLQCSDINSEGAFLFLIYPNFD